MSKQERIAQALDILKSYRLIKRHTLHNNKVEVRQPLNDVLTTEELKAIKCSGLRIKIIE